jgi:twinkle protein
MKDHSSLLADLGIRVTSTTLEKQYALCPRCSAQKTFFNAEVLTDPALLEDRFPLVITEGEIDALSFLQAGYPFVVSVPDGAPPARDAQGNIVQVPEDADDVDPANDEKYRYVLNCWDRLAKIRRIVLAGDGDEPGWRLCQELARRLGKARCSFVSYPQDCKDANEVLVSHGPAEVMKLVTGAKPFPVRGLYKLSEFPDEGPIKTFSTGFAGLDLRPHQPKEPHLLMYRGAFMVVSGLPGAGKTAWTVQLAANMAKIHGWRAAIASFEMRVSPTLRDMLRGFYLERGRSLWTPKLLQEADAWIEDRFVFIALQPDDDETEADVQWVVDRAADAVVRDGVDMLILDVATVVVAHPTKAAGIAVKNGDPVSLYDIDNGAAWVNKAELGVMVQRKSVADTVTEIGIRKVKFRGTGRAGEAYLTYDEDLEQFVA